MKKQFLTAALLVVVATSGAFAGKIQQKFNVLAEYGTPGLTTCHVSEVPDECTENAGERCQIIENSLPAFQLGSNCQIELFRSN